MNKLFLIFIILTIDACAMGGKPHIYPERKMQDKLFRPCQAGEVIDPTGKLCNKTCSEWKNKKCIKKKITVKNYCNEIDFKWFRAGSFIMIDEDQVL